MSEEPSGVSDSPGFVLVHGGEHGAWCWHKVIPRLDWPAIAVSLPGRDSRAGDPIKFGLGDNARELADTVDRAAFSPCIVVCHSLGGLTALAAEPLYTTPPEHRVFVSAVIPKPGSAGLDALPTLFRMYLRLRLKSALRKRTVIHLLPRWLAGAIWFHALDRSERKRATQALCAESPTIPLERTPNTLPRRGTSTYVVLTKDRAVRPRTQHRMTRNLDIRDIQYIDGPHEAMLSHPDLLAHELNRIARTVASRRRNSRPGPR